MQGSPTRLSLMAGTMNIPISLNVSPVAALRPMHQESPVREYLQAYLDHLFCLHLQVIP
jgi:hypothetical protein